MNVRGYWVSQGHLKCKQCKACSTHGCAWGGAVDWALCVSWMADTVYSSLSYTIMCAASLALADTGILMTWIISLNFIMIMMMNFYIFHTKLPGHVLWAWINCERHSVCKVRLQYVTIKFCLFCTRVFSIPEMKEVAYELHLFGRLCATQKVTKTDSSIFPLLDTVSLWVVSSHLFPRISRQKQNSKAKQFRSEGLWGKNIPFQKIGTTLPFVQIKDACYTLSQVWHGSLAL